MLSVLDRGGSVHDDSPPTIVRGVQLEHTSTFRLLRERGAGLYSPEAGTQAVRRAAAVGPELMVRLLPRGGVEVNSSSVDESPMFAAKQTGSAGIVQILFPIGAALFDPLTTKDTAKTPNT